MAASLTPAQSLLQIQSLLRCAGGNADKFIGLMKASPLPSLSFSKVSTVEACQYRFYLQYILRLDPHPLPDYFVKGRLLHALIAASYQKIARREAPSLQDHQELLCQADGVQARLHLCNAAAVHLQNLWPADEVLGIELPFVMLVDERLPPVIGVIDLLLRRGDTYVVIDHKSGRDFYPPDLLQMAIYRQWLRDEFRAQDSSFFYEHYRWVNNLQRIRKPAFLRSEVDLPADGWPACLQRIRLAHAEMQRIYSGGQASKNGDCYRCPYRVICRG